MSPATAVREVHPAVGAAEFCGLRASPQVPVQVLQEAEKSAVYRVVLGAEAPRSVIVKRCSTAFAETEKLLYEHILPEFSLSTLHYYGSCVDEKSTWLVVEDADDIAPSFDDSTWSAPLTDWIRTLHVEGRALKLGAIVPARGPDYFAGCLSTASSQLVRRLEREELDGGDRRTFEVALARCALLGAMWPDIDASCRRFPETLVHGDLVEENLRISRSRGTSTIKPLDWEKAGWGCPAIDLALADVELYFAATSAWFGASREEYAEFLVVGRLFRLLSHAWAMKPAEKVARYERRLAKLMQAAGWGAAA